MFQHNHSWNSNSPLLIRLLCTLLATVLQNHTYINALDFLFWENARLSFSKVKIFHSENGEKMQKIIKFGFHPMYQQILLWVNNLENNFQIPYWVKFLLCFFWAEPQCGGLMILFLNWVCRRNWVSFTFTDCHNNDKVLKYFLNTLPKSWFKPPCQVAAPSLKKTSPHSAYL